MEDSFIPTAQACQLLGLAPTNTRALHNLNIPCKKDFTSRIWSNNAIQAILKKRNRFSIPPPGFLTLQEAAAQCKRSLSYTHHLLKLNNIAPSRAPIWNGKTIRTTIVYPITQIKYIIDEQASRKNNFPPEGWLEINDCVAYLHRTPKTVRTLCKKHNVRTLTVHISKKLYNEDDIVAIRRILRRKSYTRAKA